MVDPTAKLGLALCTNDFLSVTNDINPVLGLGNALLCNCQRIRSKFSYTYEKHMPIYYETYYSAFAPVCIIRAVAILWVLHAKITGV